MPAHVPTDQLTYKGHPRKRAIRAGSNLSPLDTDEQPNKYPLLAIEALKRDCGRPRRWKDPEEVYNLGVEYFERCVETQEPITVTGLACYLGATREVIQSYEDGNFVGPNGDDPRFSDCIKHLKKICQHFAENHGFHARNPAFAIFVLKNYGWSDQIRIDHHISVEHSIDKDTLSVIEGYLSQLRTSMMSGEVVDVEPIRITGPEPEKIAAQKKKSPKNQP